jgi:hypothetical protein
MVRLATDLRQPGYLWLGTAPRVLMALLDGDLATAESLTGEENERESYYTLARDHVSTSRFHRFLLRREQGRLAELEEEIERLSISKDEAVRNAEYEEAARLRDQAEALRKKKEEMQRQWREKAKEVDGVVDEEVIAEVVSKMTGVPLTRLEK